MSDTARGLAREADQKLKGGFLSCLAGGRRFEEAAELYQQAAIQFKLTKEWQEAANCYAQCAYCAQRAEDSNGEANYHVEAGNILKKISTSGAVEQFEQAVAIFSAKGQFNQCGKLLLSVAELYEAEALESKEVKTYYKRAAEMFELDDHGKTSVTKCNLKIAEYAAKDGELQEAIKLFESEGEKALQNTLTQYGAKEHFLKAGILQLVAGDSITVNLAVERYGHLDPRFAGSREGELLAALAEAFEQADVEKFTDKLGEYDAVTKLDAWKTELLLKVKDSMRPPQGASMESLDLS